MKYKLEVSDDCIDEIVVATLKQHYQWFEYDYRNNVHKRSFSNDLDEDRKAIKKMMKAMEHVLSYWGEKV